MKHILLLLLAAILAPGVRAQSDTTTFAAGLEGWSASFAEYPAGEESFYGLTAVRAHLPAPLDTTQYALMLSGDNHSDDLFMYMKKRITGLQPNTRYTVRFDVEFASNVSTTAFGIGGAPGGAVTVKCGATAAEPRGLLDAAGYYRMNIDKGNQVGRGADMDTIGNVGVTDTTTVWTLTTRSNAAHPFAVTTDAHGSAWVIIGTDSGFEGITTLYYNRIVVTFDSGTPVDAPAAPAPLPALTLAQNFPNPFNPATTIRYALPSAGEVLLTVHDASGRRVALLHAGRRDAGTHRAHFDAAGLPSGAYVCRLTWNGQSRTRRMLLLR